MASITITNNANTPEASLSLRSLEIFIMNTFRFVLSLEVICLSAKFRSLRIALVGPFELRADD